MNEFDLRKFLYNNPLMEKKEDSKKGNKEEQKRMEGAIRDNRDHKFDIDKDEDEQRKKLSKLKKDAKKETGKGKKGNEDEQKRAEGAIKDAKDHKKALNKDIKADEKKLKKLKKDFKKDVKEGMGKSYYEDGDMKEDMDELPKSIRDKEQAQIEKDARKKGLTKEGLKDMIREKITSILNEDAELYEAEEVEVKDDEKVKVDIEKDVEIDDESSKSEIEVDSELAGESSDISAILGLLTKAQDEAKSLGDEKLMDQIGNTITFFTRKHVVQSAD